MEKLELVKNGINLVEALTEYLAKDAIGSEFFTKYLLSRDQQSKASMAQEEALAKLLEDTAKMGEETKAIASNAKANNSRLESISNAIMSLKQSVTAIEQEQKAFFEEFKDLIAQTKKITEQINDIQNISAQTNLLSFNASIEAARAGNAGKGFRVIANEVKKLSNDTNKTSEEIKKNVYNLVQSINNMEQQTKKNSKDLTSLAEETSQTLESFDSVRRVNSQNNANVSGIKSFVDNTCDGLNDVIKNVRSIEQTSSENLELFAKCASDNEMLFNDLYSFTFQLKAVFGELDRQ